jgi:hypothetical protein
MLIVRQLGMALIFAGVLLGLAAWVARLAFQNYGLFDSFSAWCIRIGVTGVVLVAIYFAGRLFGFSPPR